MSALLAGGAAIVGAGIGAYGAKSAASTQAAAADRATAAQTDMFNKTSALETPYQQSGVTAQGRLSDLLGIGGGANQANFDANAYLAANPDVAKDEYFSTHPWEHFQKYGQNENRAFTARAGTGTHAADYGSLAKPFTMADFQMDPGIQFQTQQGNLALTNSAAAKNGVLSGGALKDFIKYNQDMAGTGYQSAFDRYMTGKNFTLGALTGVANRGQAAASNTATTGAGYAGGIAGTMTGAGNAQAAGTVGAANAISGGISGAGNSYMLSQMMNGGGGNMGGPITTSANPGGVYLAPVA